MSPSRIEQSASEMKPEEERKLRKQLQERQREEAQRLKANIEKGRSMVSDTGILSLLTELKDSLDRKVRKTVLLEDYKADKAYVSLAWGSKLAVKNKRITGEQGFLSGYKTDYSCILVEFDISDESFRIGETLIQSNTWKNEPDTLIDALVKAYQYPFRNVDRYEDTESYFFSQDSYTVDSTECCGW